MNPQKHENIRPALSVFLRIGRKGGTKHKNKKIFIPLVFVFFE